MFVDCETTGLLETDRVIQFAAIFATSEGTIEGSYSTFLRADGEVGPAEAQAVHGITKEMIANAPDFSEAVAPLGELFCNRRVIAHNAPFDYGRLSHEFSLIGMEKPPKFLCSKDLCEYLGYGRLRLVEAATRFGISMSRAHRADSDASTLAQVFIHFLSERTAETQRFLASSEFTYPKS